MNTDTPQATPPVSLLQKSVAVLALAILLTAHSQVTLQHWAYRLAGIRYGKIQSVEAHGNQTVCHDAFAIFKPGELAGSKLFLGDRSFPVTDNDKTSITVDAPLIEVEPVQRERSRYLTGFAEKHALVRLALACPKINFTVSDCLLGVALLLMAIAVLRQRNWRAVVPPAAVIALLIACALTLVDKARLFDASLTRVSRGQGLKELIQYIEVFAAAYVFFRWALQSASLRRKVAVGLLAVATLMVLAGLVEYRQALAAKTELGYVNTQSIDSLMGFRYNPTRSNLSGSESSKNTFMLYLCMVLPLLMALQRSPLAKGLRWLALAVSLLGIACLLSINGLLAALLGCLAVALAWPQKWWLPATLTAFLLVTLLTTLLVKSHGVMLIDSVALHRHSDPFGLLPMPVTGGSAMGEDAFKGWNPWQQKYTERQAVLNALSFSPLLGYGIGHYQTRINAFYSSSRLPSLAVNKSATNFMERDAHGLFWVQLLETGALGFLCLLWVLTSTITNVFAARRRTTPGSWDDALLVGVLGSVVALLIGAWSMSFLSRGIQLIAIAIMALPAAILAAQTNGDTEEADSSLESGTTEMNKTTGAE